MDEVDLRPKVVKGLAPLVEDLGQDDGEVQLLLDQPGRLHQAPGEQQSRHADAMLTKDCWYLKNSYSYFSIRAKVFVNRILHICQLNKMYYMDVRKYNDLFHKSCF